MGDRLDADAPHFGRRTVLGGASVALIATAAGGPTAEAEDVQSPNGPLCEIPIVLPGTEFVYEAVFDLQPVMMLGQGPLGERRIIPISGGVFAGPRIKGKVLPGGADRQLVRTDGAHILNALYELQTDDGASSRSTTASSSTSAQTERATRSPVSTSPRPKGRTIGSTTSCLSARCTAWRRNRMW
jgi:hypothetical protein